MSHQDLNRNLHAMAAHLHRYASELKSLDDTTAAIIEYHPLVIGEGLSPSNIAVPLVEDGLNQIHSQIKAVIDFEIELEKKTKNHLALVTFTPSSIRLPANVIFSSSIASSLATTGLWSQMALRCKQ